MVYQNGFYNSVQTAVQTTFCIVFGKMKVSQKVSKMLAPQMA